MTLWMLNDKIEIELVSSLRNLLGPHHRSAGEPDDCWGTAWNHDIGGPAEHAEERQATWTDDYFFIHFGLPGAARIKVLSAQVP